MRILKVISLLLDYPDQHLRDGHAELAQAIGAAREISPEQRIALRRLLDELTEDDLMDVQERYTDLFDRGRSLSLLLFEHVHGESRDRGQAMVDLMAEYQAAGFELDARELPDYLPIFLEYLSTREEAEIGRWLGEIRHILGLITARLEERGADHALVPRALLALIGAEAEADAHREEVQAEAPDDTPEALDAVWEEEAVRFSAESDQDCALQSAEGRRLAERKRQVQGEAIRILDPVDAAKKH